MSKVSMIFGALGGVILLLMFVWLVVALHMAYTKMDVVLKYLKNSTAVLALSHYRRQGVWGQLHLIAEIAALVTCPKRHVTNGTLSGEDLNSLPASLKRLLVIWRWGIIILCGLLFLFGGIGGVAGWL